MQINETWKAHLKSYLRSTLVLNGLHDHAAGKVITRVNTMKVLHNLTRWENNLKKASRCAFTGRHAVLLVICWRTIQKVLSSKVQLFLTEAVEGSIVKVGAVWKTIFLLRPEPINLIPWCMHSRSSQCFFFFGVKHYTLTWNEEITLFVYALEFKSQVKAAGKTRRRRLVVSVDVFWHKNRTTGWSQCFFSFDKKNEF